MRFVKKKLLSVLDRIPFFYIKRLSSTNCHDIWPLQMSPITGTNFALGSNVKFKPGFQNPGWKNRARDLGNPSQPTLSYEHIEVRGKLARSWKPGPCEEALSTALKRILFLSWSDFWRSPYKFFLSLRLSIVTWPQEMFWLVKERNVRWQILEWQGMCIKKTSTAKPAAWVQLSTPFNFKSCRVLSQNCVGSVVRGSNCYFKISSTVKTRN